MLHNLLTTYTPWLDILLDWNLLIPMHLQLKVKEKNDFLENKNQRLNEKALLIYLILVWTILHCAYKKCLNVHLRNSGYALIRRNRICNVLWSSGFTTIIILYTIFLWDLLLKPELMVIILKSFYIHYSGLIIFLNNEWMKGFSNFLFTLFIFCVPRLSLLPPITSIFILKSIDIFMLDICRLLFLKWPKKIKQIYPKYLHIAYCLLWTYLYMVYVPINLLAIYKFQSLNEKLILWLWFITQYLNFVWLDYIRNYKSSQLLELCLFPNPSTESIHLTRILKNYKEFINRKSTPNKTVSVKKELWQTLICAMTMKKKINRLRKSKQMKRKLLSDDENSVEECDGN